MALSLALALALLYASITNNNPKYKNYNKISLSCEENVYIDAISKSLTQPPSDAGEGGGMAGWGK